MRARPAVPRLVRPGPNFLRLSPVVSLDSELANKMHTPAGVCDSFRDMGLSTADSFGLDDVPAPAARSSARKLVRPRRMIMKVR